MLPVIAYGHWTWSGYDFVNDTSFEMLLASHIKGFGTTLGNIPETSEREFLVSYLNNGYPLGTQALLGTLSGLTDTPVEVLYQGFIAALAANRRGRTVDGHARAAERAAGGVRGLHRDRRQPHLPVRAAGRYQGDRPAGDPVRRRGRRARWRSP